MSTILCVGSYGAEQPARATLPFAAALIAIDAGDQPQVFLRGDATGLMKDTVASRVRADEWPALAELLGRVVGLRIPVFV